MANSKNTIQNIPLASELCMNQLRTETKQFQGYNEKNTTLYGGTLSPMWDNKKELPFDKKNSYTFFNSKGEDFTLTYGPGADHGVVLYKGDTLIDGFDGYYFGKTEKLEVPPYTKAALKTLGFGQGDLVTFRQGFPGEDGDGVYINDVKVVDTDSGYDFYRIWYHMHLVVVGLGKTFDDSRGKGASVHLYCIDTLDNNRLLADTSFSAVMPVGATDKLDPMLTGRFVYNRQYFIISLTLFSGRIKSLITSYTTRFDYNTNTFTEMIEEPNVVYIEDSVGGTLAETFRGIHILDGAETIELQQGACRCTKRLVDSSGNPGTYWICQINGVTQYDPQSSPTALRYYCYATDKDGFIPTPIKSGVSRSTSNLSINAYWLNGSLISLSDIGRPIDECLGYGQNTFNYDYTHSKEARITYTKKDGTWYTYTRYGLFPNNVTIKELLKSCVVGGRYVLFNNFAGGLMPESWLSYFDVETQEITHAVDFGWILTTSPYCVAESGEVSGETTGVVFANGINAGFEISNTELVGYLPNPYIGFNLPKKDNIVFSGYYTVGDTTQSAEYQGIDPQYYGTTYPIDPNGNVILPVSMGTQIIKGYSNNDMVKEGNTAYPMIYWNNNQKVYAYYLLAGVENVTNVFSLQGQQYAVDDDNIYAVAFNGGVVSQVQSVSYKKNLTFLGTLPTQAVFWSDYNKTFYAFTGDRILSKMFEASDIHKILYVGQNPSSLSLWVCTDTGIYVLSDTDQFKLDYVSEMVEFQPQKALLLTEGEGNNEIHTVSLYLKDGEEGEMIPVKLQTAYYGLGNEMKAVMDCWYLRLFDENNTKGYVKAKVHTITDVTRHTEEKTFEVNPSDYDENHIVYLRFQPKYQECVSMQLELETNLGIYQISLGVNTTDSTTQVSKFNF